MLRVHSAVASRQSGNPVVLGSPYTSIDLSDPHTGWFDTGATTIASSDKEPLKDAGIFYYDVEHRNNWGPCARFIAHSVAIGIVVAAVMCVIGVFFLIVVQSALSLQSNWSVYRKGADTIVQSLQRTADRAAGAFTSDVNDALAKHALEKIEGALESVVTFILSNTWGYLVEFMMMALYIAFWLFDPIPMGNEVEELFKRYIVVKGCACLGYGVCVGVLLYLLKVDLAPVFGLMAFFLSFVPEMGAIVAIILPMPVIIFDSRLDSPVRTLLIATFAQLCLKFVFANVVEVKLVEADQLMRMHPVVILLAVTFFGLLWGPTGMLLSVPLAAYVKVAILSETVPPRYRDPVLVFLEGDRDAPAKYARRT